jgi:non-specific protein-tyrosine kinase
MNAFRILRTNLRFLDVDKPPVSVLVSSSMAEEGKTTVAVGLALAAAAGGDRNVLLVEADLHRPVHSERLGLKESPGIADYLSGSAGPNEVVQTLEFVDPAQGAASDKNGEGPVRSRLSCITAGSRTPWPAELLSSERFKDFLDKVSKVYDLVVLDSPPILGAPEATELASQVDGVIFCTRLGRTTTDQASAGREALDRLPPRPMGMVVTGVSVRDPGYYSYAYSYGSERVLTKV